MILDQELYDSSSYGSAKRILCRCDQCGTERKVAKQKIYNRGGYSLCLSCKVSAMWQQKTGRVGPVGRDYVETTCKDCGKSKKRRVVTLLKWGGRCQSCAMKEIYKRPEIKEIRRACGLASENLKKAWSKPKNRQRGPNHHNWRGGITPEVERIRTSSEIKVWRRAVFFRDNFTCQACRKKSSGNLEADHIMPFSLFPELRLSLENGRTMCARCHRTYGAKVRRGEILQAAFTPIGITNDMC